MDSSSEKNTVNMNLDLCLHLFPFNDFIINFFFTLHSFLCYITILLL